MAAMQPVPKPAGRDLDALWKYVDAIAREVEHMSRHIDEENLEDGAVTMEKLSREVREKLEVDA